MFAVLPLLGDPGLDDLEEVEDDEDDEQDADDELFMYFL